MLSYWAQAFPADGVEVSAIGPSLEPVRCAKGLRVLSDVMWDGAGPLGVLVYPGGIGTRRNLAAGEPGHARPQGLGDGGTLMACAPGPWCSRRPGL